MALIDAEQLRGSLAAYRNAHALHGGALEQLEWLADRGVQDHHWAPALEMRATTYEGVTLAALDLAHEVSALVSATEV